MQPVKTQPFWKDFLIVCSFLLLGLLLLLLLLLLGLLSLLLGLLLLLLVLLLLLLVQLLLGKSWFPGREPRDL